MATWARCMMLLWLGAAAAGCPDMAVQPRGDTLEASDFFEDGKLAREWVEGVVPRGHPNADEAFETGRRQGQLVARAPVDVSLSVLQRGRERYNIFCAPCHNQNGDGAGMIVLRGFTAPPSLHETRLREAPDGHIYDVITHGFGRMYPQAERVAPADRWAIVLYIRALQLSRRGTPADVPPPWRDQLTQSTADPEVRP